MRERNDMYEYDGYEDDSSLEETEEEEPKEEMLEEEDNENEEGDETFTEDEEEELRRIEEEETKHKNDPPVELKHLTPEERAECVRILEEAAGRPLNRMYELGERFTEIYQFSPMRESEDKDAKKKVVHKSDLTYERSLESLTQEELDMISRVMQSDDEILKEAVQNFVLASSRFYIRRMVNRFCRDNATVRQDFVSACAGVVANILPRYQSKFRLSTWLRSHMVRALSEERKLYDNEDTSKHYQQRGQEIKKVIAKLQQMGNFDPTEKEIASCGQTMMGYTNLTKEAVINYNRQHHKVVEQDEAFNNIPDDYNGPEAQLLEKERKAEIHKLINELDPRRRRIILAELEIFETAPSHNFQSLLTAVQKTDPTITRDELKYAQREAFAYIAGRIKARNSREETRMNGFTLAQEDEQEYEDIRLALSDGSLAI